MSERVYVLDVAELTSRDPDPQDPLDVEYDGRRLRELLERDIPPPISPDAWATTGRLYAEAEPQLLSSKPCDRCGTMLRYDALEQLAGRHMRCPDSDVYESRIGSYTHPGYNGVFDLGPPTPTEPLDVEYDGVRLRVLLEGDEFNRRESSAMWRAKLPTPAQRAAISAHWSAQLRAKVAASKAADAERERNRVFVDVDDA